MISALEFEILRRAYPQAPDKVDGSAYAGKSKLAVLMGPGFFDEIRGKDVVDFGCGSGREALEMAQAGAASVIGLDIQESLLVEARERCAGYRNIDFRTPGHRVQADVVVSIDSFEHFANPQIVLASMWNALKPGGKIMVSFGPTWYHPLGGHLFSVFPWAHLLFTEKALIRWRSTFKTDGATRFSECAGGLNKMTIARFERLVAASPLKLEKLECVPIRRLERLHNRLTREFTTAIVRCTLAT
jgi:SAM-dependent methyltransferase